MQRRSVIHMAANICLKSICLAILAVLILSCSHTSKEEIQLDNADKLIEQNPDSAIKILSGIDTLDLPSAKHKNKRLLLHIYCSILTNSKLQYTDTELTRAVSEYTGTQSEYEVKSLIIKAIDAQDKLNAVASMEYLKDAEFLALQIDDTFDLAIIYRLLASIYANSYNGTISTYYADKSHDIFQKLGNTSQILKSRWFKVNILMSKGEYKAALDSLMALSKAIPTDSTIQHNYLEQLARLYDANEKTRQAIEIWNSLYDNDSISSNTLAHWARAYRRINEVDSAYCLIKRALTLPHNTFDEYLCRNIEYDILEQMGRKTELATVDSLRSIAWNKVLEERNIEETSLAVNQKYDTSTRKARLELSQSRNKLLITIIIALLIMAISACTLLYYRKRIHILNIEHENDLLKIQNLQNNLFESGHKQEITTDKISGLFNSRFKIIDSLASSYFECKETAHEQKRIYAEVCASINSFSSEASLKELEDIVDAYNNGLMQRFRQDYPKLPPSQYRLALYLFCRFSLQSISIFTRTDIRNIYVYKSRLKTVISKSATADKETYLQYFS